MTPNFRVSLSSVITNAKGETLFTLRRLDDDYGGYWDAPGGGMDVGEQPDDAIAREIAEECGLDVTIHGPVATFSKTGNHGEWVTFILYRCSYVGDPNRVKIDEDHTEYRWMRLEDAYRELEFASGVGGLLKKLMQES